MGTVVGREFEHLAATAATAVADMAVVELAGEGAHCVAVVVGLVAVRSRGPGYISSSF